MITLSFGDTSNTDNSAASVQSESEKYTPLQRWLVMGSIFLGGFLALAFVAKRNKNNHFHDDHEDDY